MVIATGPRGDMLFNPEPGPSGTYRLRDTGGDKPNATRLNPAQAFGLRRLYTLHTPHCARGKRPPTRARSS